MKRPVDFDRTVLTTLTSRLGRHHLNRKKRSKMKPVSQLSESRDRASTPLMDVLIRIVLIGALAVLCYQIFSPFLTLTVWSIILAVTLYPLHQRLARRVRKQW